MMECSEIMIGEKESYFLSDKINERDQSTDISHLNKGLLVST